ncbi:MAG: DNA polymerase III subunit alpha [Deltaproteobacteria bacterium]|nr:MAG: DNA polymerase III subunit alpha [Deltaproteobacteria bacterium]
MSAGFTHLHLHTQYSLLDGAIRISDLVEKCKAFDMDSVAVTDHGAMFGALEFYIKAKEAGIKPIVGCEFYVAPESRHIQKAVDGQKSYHLVLLAMNHTGYKNLMKMASIAQFEGFYYKPRIDMEVLKEYNEGVIALTACLQGIVPNAILKKDLPRARKKAEELYEIFGDRLYFELQENGIAAQQSVNDGLKELGREMGIKLVATNDCHYLTREEAKAHELLLCLQTGKTINDPKRFKLPTEEFYFKSAQEMRTSFAHCPEAIASTQEIADRCNLEIDFGNYYFPKFPVEEGETLESMFTKACWQGLENRFAKMQETAGLDDAKRQVYTERLQAEIDVILKMGFSGYFLIVADFINWAKDRKIPVGPGRGSGAGSLAAYAMSITNIDPILYDLIFERFLNIERKSMPDFDVDFCQERRGEVIDYIKEKYGGSSHVAQIVTYGKMKTRGVIRDVGRVLNMPFGDVDKVAKMVPETEKVTVDKALQAEPKLQEAVKNDPKIAELISFSRTLEGLARNTSTHAAGIVISPTPLTDYLPVCRGINGETLTQYDMSHTEKTGLIKFDFLGLKTLTVIDKTLKHIQLDKGIEIDIDNIPLDDSKAFELLCKGNTLGVFQLESPNMRDLLIRLEPEQFSDLIALVALYRPGPIKSGMINDFIDTRHGIKEAEYLLPEMEPILKETFGLILYQEQVMKIANVLANYSLGDADILRRAMGKKKHDVMANEKIKFLKGAKDNNIPPETAEQIFDLMEYFSSYGFNKSHSAAYAMVAYQTAYLKAHFMPQFMAALLSSDMSNTDKVVLYIHECKEHNIEVLPPDINQSVKDFNVKEDAIRFGMAAVKNVGENALDCILKEREKNGPFTSISDFCNRVDSQKVNSRVIESLIKSGCFDSLGHYRSQNLAILEQAMEQAKAVQRDMQSGQISLFTVAPEITPPAAISQLPMPDIAEWDDQEKLKFEKETVGFYITGHPLDRSIDEIKTITDCTIQDLKSRTEGQAVRIGCLIRTCRNLKSKKGESMAILSVEDLLGALEVVVFPKTYSEYETLLSTTEPVIIQGRLQQEERGPKILAETIHSLPEARAAFTDKTHIRLHYDKISRQKLEKLKKTFYQHYGPSPLHLTLQFSGKGEVDFELAGDLGIRPSQEFTDSVEDILDYKAVSFTQKPIQLKNPQRHWQNNGERRSTSPG